MLKQILAALEGLVLIALVSSVPSPSLKMFPRKPSETSMLGSVGLPTSKFGQSQNSTESSEYDKQLKSLLKQEKFRGLADLLRQRQDPCAPCTCGLSHREERIVGGSRAELNSYPWLVALMYKRKFYCGGAVISSRYILTAAHCVHGVPKNQITLVMGEHDRNFTDESDTIYRKIGTIIRHPQFNRANFHNDIAVLRLDKPIKFSKAVAPACLPVDLEDEDFSDEVGIVAGWGRTREKGTPSHILREVEVPIMTNEACKTSTRYNPSEITDKMMCAGYVGGKLDACQGDSGGPLNWEDSRDSSVEGTTYVIGIVSWGQGCARPRYPGVYTRITEYLEWIRENTIDSCFCGLP